jgi:hypothetical protein
MVGDNNKGTVWTTVPKLYSSGVHYYFSQKFFQKGIDFSFVIWYNKYVSKKKRGNKNELV